MKKTSFLLGMYFVLAALSGCSKIDWKDIFHRINDKKCDYVEASSSALSEGNSQELLLFSKDYSQNLLQKIRAHFRNVAGSNYNLVPMDVVYQGKRMILINETQGDTVAILDFNQAGRLTSAQATPQLFNDWAQRYTYRFLYSAGTLSEIQYMETDNNPANDTWNFYLKLDYGANKNVSKISFYSFGAVTTDTYITYQYDLSKKGKRQFYPDEMQGDYFYFWYLLKYLHLFPELQPKNLLVSSFNPVEYPGDIQRNYSEHQFDASGNLISYKQNAELWKVKWNCSK